MQLTLNEDEIRAIERIVKHFWYDEFIHYHELDKPDEHIYNDLFIINTALGFVTWSRFDNDNT